MVLAQSIRTFAHMNPSDALCCFTLSWLWTLPSTLVLCA